ncbi:MAG: XkdF-like putative serine protease domain-containing protein [Halobacteriota archaeon]
MKTEILRFSVKPIHWKILAKKTQSENEYRIVYGVVLDSDAIDDSDENVKFEYIKAIAHYFMINYEAIDIPRGCAIVESYLVPVDNSKIREIPVKKSSWVMAFQITDSDLWQEIKRDKFEGIEIAPPVPIP